MITWTINAFMRLLSPSNPANNIRAGTVGTTQIISDETNASQIAIQALPTLNAMVLNSLQNTYGQTYFYPSVTRSTGILGYTVTIWYLHNLDYNGTDDLTSFYSSYLMSPPPP